jgi:hypothetical protein
MDTINNKTGTAPKRPFILNYKQQQEANAADSARDRKDEAYLNVINKLGETLSKQSQLAAANFPAPTPGAPMNWPSQDGFADMPEF